MSIDPATFVAGVPVKISEKYRPPRKVNLPVSCQHQINSDLLTQDEDGLDRCLRAVLTIVSVWGRPADDDTDTGYNFAVEKTTLQWVQERRNRLEKEDTNRRERIAEYDKKKAELKAKEEEEERQRKEQEEMIKQEKEKERLKREEEERSRLEEEEEIKKLEEEVNQEEQSQDIDKTKEAESGDVTPNTTQSTEINGNESTLAGPTSKVSQEGASHEVPQSLPTSGSDDSNYYSSGAMNSVNVGCRAETNVSNNATSYDLMLKPTLIPSHKSVRSPSKTPANINFADFEGEGNDPFDSAALKSINDMEELAKVLDSSHITQNPAEGANSVQGPAKDGQAYPNTFPNGQVSYGFGQYPYFMPPQQQHLQQSLQQQNMAQQPRPGFPHYGNHLAKNPQVTRTSSTPSSSDPQYAKDPARTFQNKYFAQPWGNGYNNVNSPSKPAQFVPYDYCLQAANIANSVSNTTQGVMSPSNTGTASTLSTYTSGGCSTVPSVDRGTTVNKRQDLEDFYSRYYLQNKSQTHQNQQSGMQSGESTPSHSSSSGAAGSTSGSLRSCRSVPDLSAAEDSEVTRYSSGLQSQSDSRGISHTPPPRPSSTGLTGLEDWKPLPDISGLSETSPSQRLYQSSPVHHPTITSPHTPTKPSRLPDPFTELNTEAQGLVQNMAEMGFPRPRVARAVQKLGTDHKKLIEVLLVLQSLQGNGEDGYKAERAFYHYMGDVQKTKDHLAAAKQLLDLGFEEEQIVDALLKHDNNRDKALEELIA
ncbi:Ubiquitin-associated protein 1 [Chionoecetes opilio]|uniref:Ubiquitin-associated protein 1 n=1 Tax=Chionoecetes opilio TaxID=41210 RepID=A0A8J4YM35_CHIOP|nr:Ubiquitin-associated protein 1 [Chionoecetes opilio]